ncbi:SET domain protein [Akanthomyces lecanii RCEF 1005]|uniref:SET domain protein n=1 Tax=Akanthomyces lecanii RCEF 1005 TaxID=1081108 RepID=A0A168HPE3_CORDF|nr:SET domain protein [Akanthomyces lecanii RCEF 1005]
MSPSAKVDALVAWATSNSAVLHPDVHIYQDAVTGFSFQVKPAATQPLAGDYTSGPPIVRLPAALSLSYLNAISPETPGAPLASPLLAAGALPPHVLGRLFLIKEYLAGPSSFWHPYIQALPQPADAGSWLLPAFWDADDAELLEGTNVEVGLARIRDDLRRDLAAIQAVLLPLARGSTADVQEESNKRLVDGFRPELYRWAYAIFSSRSFRPSLVLSDDECRVLPPGVSTDDFSVLLPLFDIGNHDMTAPVRWQRVAAGCELQTSRAYQPGEQVFNNYSFKTNAELLLGYGFMIPPTAALHNDYIHVRKRAAAAGGGGGGGGEASMSEEYLISARPLSDTSSVLARSKLPAVAGFDVEHASSITPAFQHVQPDMVWDIFTAIAPGDACKQLIPVDDNGEDADRRRRLLFLAGQVDGACLPYFAQTAAIIQNKVIQELERLNETDVEVDDDERARLTPCQKLALEYRDRCRVVLESTLEMMNNDKTLAAAMEAMGEEE